MAVLMCKNIETEGPGTIEGFLRKSGIPYTIVELSKEEGIPNPDNFDTLVMMGGPMSVNDRIPYIIKEERLVRDFIVKDKKIFGVCLGAQIMAKALGAKVYVGQEKEIGWYDIELTAEGIKDLLMQKLAIHPEERDFWKRFKVFHWHGETFDIPHGAVLLASSKLYPNQAFRYGNNAYAFQFHIEVSKEMIYDWFSTTGGSASSDEKDKSVDISKLKEETEKFYNVYYGRAMKFYESFFRKT